MPHKRIYEFEFTTENGLKQSINENDFFTRADFIKERREFKKSKLKIIDKWTNEPFIPYKKR